MTPIHGGDLPLDPGIRCSRVLGWAGVESPRARVCGGAMLSVCPFSWLIFESGYGGVGIGDRGERNRAIVTFVFS